MTEKNKEEPRVCKNCYWYESSIATCMLHYRDRKPDDTCDDCETPHVAAIYDLMIFGNKE